MPGRSKLTAPVLAALAGLLLAGCSDPYRHEPATSGAAGSTTTTTSVAGASSTTSTATTAPTPDLDQSPGAGVGPTGGEIAAATTAARAFLPVYLAYTYGQAAAARIADADPGLIAQLAASPPNVPPTVRARHPRVTGLGSAGGQTGRVALQATVSDGAATYAVPLTVTLEHGRWLVTSVQ